MQVMFRNRATNYRALLRKMTYEDKASYDSTPPCSEMPFKNKNYLSPSWQGARDGGFIELGCSVSAAVTGLEKTEGGEERDPEARSAIEAPVASFACVCVR